MGVIITEFGRTASDTFG